MYTEYSGFFRWFDSVRSIKGNGRAFPITQSHGMTEVQRSTKLKNTGRGHVKTVNSTVMARGTDGIDTILQPTIFMKQKRMSKEVSRESTCPHVSLIVYISVTYHVVSLCTPAGSVSENGMLYTGVKKLETVMVDAVCFSTFTSFLIVQS
ncbi:unnamed protein product [Brassica rapa]|uniref:Uncharacterized protein n=2 Tax=Brassica TaxID=3705 RepID=A0A8D9M281_BRACM|nr:unnamed protein product [Brassica napus]CAG7895616.1 unnamed protein product [Brassica rapa]